MSKRIQAKPATCATCPLCKEPISDSTLIEHLDGACMQTARALANDLLVRAPLDNCNVDARQCQFAGQHQPSRTSSNNHHGMLSHSCTAAASTSAARIGERPFRLLHLFDPLQLE